MAQEKRHLRPYQGLKGALGAIRSSHDSGIRRQLLALATGLGKAVVAANLTTIGFLRLLILAHREELLDQAAEKLRVWNPGFSVQIDQAERRADLEAVSMFDSAQGYAVCASVATIGRSGSSRLTRYPTDFFDAVVIDEAHHASAQSYRSVIEHFRLKGHNPKKHGRPSHHPLLAMLSEPKLILHAWMRSGNTGSARGVCEFLSEALARLEDPRRVTCLRADSGFFIGEFLKDLEAREMKYAISVRMQRPLQKAISCLPVWRLFGRGLEVSELMHEMYPEKTARRIVVVREIVKERPEARGRKLFDIVDYTYHSVVTNLTLPPEEVWRFYNGRADCENRIKELKYGLNADGFCLQSFWGTATVFQLICFLFNLLTAFKAEVLQNLTLRLETLRYLHFVVGAQLSSSARKLLLRLGLLQEKSRECFAALMERVSSLSSTVTQFPISLPSRWRPPPPSRRIRPPKPPPA